MKHFLIFIYVFSLLVFSPILAQQTGPSVRIKDIGNIIEERDNQLMGFGLVVGLRNTGDSKSTGFTHLALRNLLGKYGVSTSGANFDSRNTAAVMVTATLPPFIKKGQRVSVAVSALGDSTSLIGGTLLLTPMQGADLNTYAVAQGPIVVGAASASTATNRYDRNQSTVGLITNGAIVEADVPVTFSDQHNITIVLNDSNFITVSRATESIQKNGFPGARAVDANMIKIPLSDLNSSDLVRTIADIENIEVVPDSSSKIVINSRTGTVVIGEKVRLFPVALTHGGVTIQISEQAGGLEAAAVDPIQVTEVPADLLFLNPAGTLTSLVNSLNSLGATPKDLISILQALREAKALIAHIEII